MVECCVVCFRNVVYNISMDTMEEQSVSIQYIFLLLKAIKDERQYIAYVDADSGDTVDDTFAWRPNDLNT